MRALQARSKVIDPNAVVRPRFKVGGTRISDRMTLKDVAAISLPKVPIWR